MLVYGIPEFRLPKEKVVKKEIEKVKELGVKFETNVVIGKSTTIDQLMEEEDFEAVFIGSGAGLPMFMGIPGETANGVFSANEYLTRSNLMKPSMIPTIHQSRPERKLLLSAAVMWRWMQPEQLFVLARKSTSYIDAARQNFRQSRGSTPR